MILLAKELGVNVNPNANPTTLMTRQNSKLMTQLKKYEAPKRKAGQKIYSIPYNAKGELDRSVKMELDLSPGAQVQIMMGRDAGCKGECLGQRMHPHFTMRFPTAPHNKVMAFGAWWIPLYAKGLVPKLGVMNVKPTVWSDAILNESAEKL